MLRTLVLDSDMNMGGFFFFFFTDREGTNRLCSY